MIGELLDLVGAVFLLMGAVLCLMAAIALVRFPDLLCKMHSITKPQVLGLLFVATGISFSIRTWWVFVVCTLIVALQLITSPVSATLVSRAAYRTGMVEDGIMVMDDLATDLARAGYQLAEPSSGTRSHGAEPAAEQAEPAE